MTAALAAALVAAGIAGGGLGWLLTWPGLRYPALARAARWPLAAVPWARALCLWRWRVQEVPVPRDGVPVALDDARAAAFTDLTRGWDRASRRRARRHEKAMAEHWARKKENR